MGEPFFRWRFEHREMQKGQKKDGDMYVQDGRTRGQDGDVRCEIGVGQCMKDECIPMRGLPLCVAWSRKERHSVGSDE